MQLIHSAITSPVFELVKIIELDLTLGEDLIPTRIEILRDMARDDFFRCHIRELEYFTLTPTFPCDDHGKPLHISSDVHLAERSSTYAHFNKRNYKGFSAPNTDAALRMILDDLAAFLEHVTNRRPVTQTGAAE
ncbi:MAG: hypothetical protein ACKV2V_12405 [Blastocatellia bacterium]